MVLDAHDCTYSWPPWLDMKNEGDVCTRRGPRQRRLSRSSFCNNYKVATHGRTSAIQHFQEPLRKDRALYNSLWALSGCRLICHCTSEQDCYADVLIAGFSRSCLAAWHRRPHLCPRDEPSSDEGSTADEGAPSHGADCCRNEPPMQVGVDDIVRRLLRRPVTGFARAMACRSLG